MTNLEALNHMLATIGEAPVTDYSTTAVPEAVQARAVLDNLNREVQSIGLHCNTDYNVVFTPHSVTKEIALTSSLLQVDGMYPYDDVVKRGLKLYDRSTRLYTFNNPVTCTTVTLLSFEDLPHPHQWYITVRAARIFQQQVLGSMELERFTIDDELRAKAAMMSAEMRSSDHTILDYAPVFRAVLRRE